MQLVKARAREYLSANHEPNPYLRSLTARGEGKCEPESVRIMFIRCITGPTAKRMTNHTTTLTDVSCLEIGICPGTTSTQARERLRFLSRLGAIANAIKASKKCIPAIKSVLSLMIGYTPSVAVSCCPMDMTPSLNCS